MSDNGHGQANRIGDAGGPPPVPSRGRGPAGGGYDAGPEHAGGALIEYLRVLWRRKWVIALVVVLAGASALALSMSRPEVYEASADLIYEKALDISNPLTGQSLSDASERSAQLTSAGSVIASPDIGQAATARLQQQGLPVAGFEITTELVAATTTGAVTGATNTLSSVVRITATSGNPKLSAAAADAYALSFVDYRRNSVLEQIQRALVAVNDKLDSYPEAARQSTDYMVLQQRFRDLQLLKSTATGNFRVLAPATVPESPISPKPVRDTLLGLAAGLVVAICAVFLLEQFDTRLRRPEEVAALFRRPVLGRIPRVSRRQLEDGALLALQNPGSELAESLRLVRTNLDFMAVDDSVRSIMVTSCLQGEGKSFAVANLAVTMAMGGKKVIVVDADLRRPRQHSYFSLRNDTGVSTVVTGQCPAIDALQPVGVAYLESAPAVKDFDDWSRGVEACSRLYVMPSGPIPPNPGEIVASKRFASLIADLSEQADLVLIDTPAMLPVGDTAAIASRAGGVVFLADLRVVKRPQLAQAAQQLTRLATNVLGVVVRVEGSSGRYGYSYRYAYTADGEGKKRRAAVGSAPSDGTG